MDQRKEKRVIIQILNQINNVRIMETELSFTCLACGEQQTIGIWEQQVILCKECLKAIAELRKQKK